MKKFALMITAIATGLAMTSCLDSDYNKVTNTVTRSYAKCFNTVYDATTGDIAINQQPKYTLTIKSTSKGENSIQISMTNVKLGDDIAYTTFDLPDLPMKVTGTSAPYVEATDVRPTNIATPSINFSSIYVSVLDRYIHNNSANTNEFYPVYTINFVVNNRYTVTTYPTEIQYFGETKSTATASGSVFTSSDPRYAITFDPDKKTASIDITGAQFVSAMPKMNMTFPDIPFTTGINSLEIKSDAVTPTIAGTPYPTFPITGLEATINTRQASATLVFDCNPMSMGDYHVDASLSYLLKQNK